MTTTRELELHPSPGSLGGIILYVFVFRKALAWHSKLRMSTHSYCLAVGKTRLETSLETSLARD
jgi:hypothetical protein